MKRSSTLLIAFLAVVSCSKKEIPNLMGRWEDATPHESSLERKVAQANVRQCLKDTFSIDVLKAEIAFLEKSYTRAQRIEGKWRGVDLSKLTYPETVYLTKFGDSIGDQKVESNTITPISDQAVGNTNFVSNGPKPGPNSGPGAINSRTGGTTGSPVGVSFKATTGIDYTRCSSVPCIINLVYGNENSIAGYVHYLWFLKFGYVLSADNDVREKVSQTPGVYNGRSYGLSSYLWSERELFGFWRISHILRSPFTNIRLMKEIQRIPRGLERFETPGDACGLADSGGIIFLNDGCLNFEEEDIEKGWFYQKVVHEMGHQVDYEQGKLFSPGYRSQSFEYYDFAGFVRHEFVNVKRQTEVRYTHKPTFSAVSDYSGRDPLEHFAEAVAFFRTDGEITKNKMPSVHRDYISKNYFSSKYYDSSSQIDQWVNDEYSLDIVSFSLRAVVDCQQKIEGTSNYFKSSDFSKKLEAPVLNCLGKKAEEITEYFRGKVLVSEADACLMLGDLSVRQLFDQAVKKAIAASMEEAMAMDANSFADYERSVSVLTSSRLGKSSFLNCYQNSNEDLCYQTEVSKKLSPRLAAIYVGKYPLNKIKQEVLVFYKNFIAYAAGDVSQNINRAWDECLKNPINDSVTPSGTNFVAKGYLHPVMHNCINTKVPEMLKTLVVDIVNLGGLKHPKELMIVTDEIRPILSSFLNGRYEADKKNERNWVSDYSYGSKGQELRAMMLSDMSWATNILDLEAMKTDCAKVSVTKIPYSIVFHVKNELMNPLTFGSKICADLDQTKQVQDLLSKATPEIRQRLLTSIKDSLIREGRKIAQTCASQIPREGFLQRHKGKRLDCLKSKWNEIEERVILNGSTHPAVILNGIDEMTIRENLMKSRSNIQTALNYEFEMQ